MAEQQTTTSNVDTSDSKAPGVHQLVRPLNVGDENIADVTDTDGSETPSTSPQLVATVSSSDDLIVAGLSLVAVPVPATDDRFLQVGPAGFTATFPPTLLYSTALNKTIWDDDIPVSTSDSKEENKVSAARQGGEGTEVPMEPTLSLEAASAPDTSPAKRRQNAGSGWKNKSLGDLGSIWSEFKHADVSTASEEVQMAFNKTCYAIESADPESHSSRLTVRDAMDEFLKAVWDDQSTLTSSISKGKEEAIAAQGRGEGTEVPKEPSRLGVESDAFKLASTAKKIEDHQGVPGCGTVLGMLNEVWHEAKSAPNYRSELRNKFFKARDSVLEFYWEQGQHERDEKARRSEVLRALSSLNTEYKGTPYGPGEDREARQTATSTLDGLFLGFLDFPFAASNPQGSDEGTATARLTTDAEWSFP